MLLLAYILLIGCSRSPVSGNKARLRVDSLNQRAYDWHYKDIDSVRTWAMEAMGLAKQIQYGEGHAEALNNLAFERFQQMDFDSVLILARQVGELTQSPTERLIADVMQMKVAQRTSENLEFFRCRSRAIKHVNKLSRREKQLDAHTYHRFCYGCSEMHIVASTYFYYLDQKERAIEEIRAAEPYCQMPEDTAQWLNYCYMRGSGGLSEKKDIASVTLEEFGYLMRSFWMARYEGYRFFEANVEQSLASLIADTTRLAIVKANQPEQITLLTTLFGPDDTAMALAEAAYNDFLAYDDLYQEACALRTLGELSFDAGNYDKAIDYYKQALSCVNLHHLCYYAPDTVLQPEEQPELLEAYDPLADEKSVERCWMESETVKTVPEWIAGIRQQLSVAYSALNCKAESDFNRNIYLDLLDVTREDVEFESHAAELKAESLRLRWMVVAVVFMAIVVGLLTWLLIRTNRRRTEAQDRLLKQKFQQVQEEARKQKETMAEEQEMLREQQNATELRLQKDKRHNIEKRAKLQLVYDIVPFLDRIINEIQRMKKRGETTDASLTYIGELTDRITQYNTLLTEWIQMEQGQLSLQLSSFALEPLFASLRKSHFAYEQKNLTLHVDETNLSVKADRALTLFMINTLADNARKFTPRGGAVTISASSGEDKDGRYVEISVKDTGVGLSEEDIDLILTHKVYDAGEVGKKVIPSREKSQKGFGFGLMNCKGIIEKYKKTNPLFRVCCLGIESRVGEGSRFFFRLPRVMMVTIAFFVGSHLPLMAQPKHVEPSAPLNRSQAETYALADSIYFCNINGRYADAVVFGKAALKSLSDNHVSHSSTAVERLTLRDNGLEPIEFLWWNRREKIDYKLLLGMRNEVAIAALALHDWSLYRYNNRIYTRLYKLTNQDATLEDYCMQTERSQQNKRIVLMLIVILLVFGALAIYWFYVRPRIHFRRTLAQISAQRLQQFEQSNEEEHERQQSDFEMAEDEHRRRLYEESRLHVQNQIIDNCLSAIKHETMYYPGRIQQLLKRGGDLSTLSETVSYYKEIFTLLSAQARQQSEAVNFRRHHIVASDFAAPLSRLFLLQARRAEIDTTLVIQNELGDMAFRGDSDLLAMLLDALFEAELSMWAQYGHPFSGTKPITLTISKDGLFSRITLTNTAIKLTDEQLHDLFTPHPGGIPLLICKQIIREHDTFMGHPGCRINAEAIGEGHMIWFTLPLVQSNAESSE